ncbi:PD-(D/E)XK motif protein [bacterium]|nr:PD-(D/E)XK motif protein [bacterium]
MENDIEVPNWSGLKCSLITLQIPQENSTHLSFCVHDQNYNDVFSAFCSDLVECLDKSTSNIKRRTELISFLERWKRFFQMRSPDGLSSTRQQGLFGELWWLRKLINKGFDKLDAVKSWKGCQRNYHDFDLPEAVIEVKTTMSKEPRKVWINNERQLDDSDQIPLYLFVLSLHKIEATGISLPELVTSVRNLLNDNTYANLEFEHSLIEAGYLEIHVSNYSKKYIIKKEELFKIGEHFPRIISVHDGVGDVRYTVTIGACSGFKIDFDTFFQIKR